MDYLEYYQLKEQPFSIAVDNRFYYNSSQHSEALIRLRYAADTQKGLALLVGDVGAGKTTLARRLLDELDERFFHAALLVVIHAGVTPEWLVRKITMQLGVEKPSDDKTELLSQLYRRLVELHDQNKKAVVLIDEAQMLGTKGLMEEIRGILNIELDGQKLLTFVLFGLQELDNNLSLDLPLKQRVAIRYQLTSFTLATTEDYVRYRLQIAGATRDLFSKSALKAVHDYSGGIPRLINTICDNALLEGFLRKKEQLEPELIREVAADLKLLEPAGA
ncbi:MAG: AAA family ATPase [Nitrospirota bacterium]